MKRTAIVVVATLLALAACTTPTPYQPLAGGTAVSGGYSDQVLDDTHFRVSFRGNDVTSREQVETYLLYRAAELTAAKGFDWFEMVDRHTRNTGQTYIDSYGPWGYGYWRPSWRYGRGGGWYGGWYGDAFWGPWGPYDATINTIDRFDASHNVKLKTYAEYKIRGAILDGLRGLDWAPRQQRKRSKQIEAAMVSAEHRLQRSASEEEIAQELGLGIKEYHEWLVEVRGLNLGSLEGASDDEDSRDLLNFISDDEEDWPSRLLERNELKKLLALAITKMPEVEKTVLGLYYHEELTLREISKILHLHESRISQLKSQAILRLRSHMATQWPAAHGMVKA